VTSGRSSLAWRNWAAAERSESAPRGANQRSLHPKLAHAPRPPPACSLQRQVKAVSSGSAWQQHRRLCLRSLETEGTAHRLAGSARARSTDRHRAYLHRCIVTQTMISSTDKRNTSSHSLAVACFCPTVLWKRRLGGTLKLSLPTHSTGHYLTTSLAHRRRATLTPIKNIHLVETPHYTPSLVWPPSCFPSECLSAPTATALAACSQARLHLTAQMALSQHPKASSAPYIRDSSGFKIMSWRRTSSST
jgi:hypothetical protein